MNTTTTATLPSSTRIVFIGGGNMASAIIGGLIRHGLPAAQIQVIEPFEATRQALLAQHGVTAVPDAPTASAALSGADLLVWAVKPQVFGEAVAPVRAHTGKALHLSVMAGIRADAIATTTGAARIVRCMPNTPALIGQGMTGLFAAPAATPADRMLAEAVIASTGGHLWVEREDLLDAVTALSGSGPAYVFYFLEAMQQAGVELGLTADQARHLATATFTGGSALAAQSPEALATLRERVTSKGGTTYAALTVMREAGMAESFIAAMHACAQRAKELGQA
ncbi:pyrroline-5-carboxylate reductase [Ottowia sp.]|uniref:pyrroline-5-carboxylate reductase n=1 Tax=Ottowia sp. TaxID=1898956 RepID=UPI003A89F4BA